MNFTRIVGTAAFLSLVFCAAFASAGDRPVILAGCGGYGGTECPPSETDTAKPDSSQADSAKKSAEDSKKSGDDAGSSSLEGKATIGLPGSAGPSSSGPSPSGASMTVKPGRSY